MVNKEEIGNDVTVEIADTTTEVTSASYSEEPQTSSTQFNSSLAMNIVVTGVEYSGSFEHDGANSELRDRLFSNDTNPKTEFARKIDEIVFSDSESTYTFKGCIIGSRSKDFPADDRTSVTYDFVAEKLVRRSV
jgi:hypothetical protein